MTLRRFFKSTQHAWSVWLLAMDFLFFFFWKNNKKFIDSLPRWIANLSIPTHRWWLRLAPHIIWQSFLINAYQLIQCTWARLMQNQYAFAGKQTHTHTFPRLVEVHKRNSLDVTRASFSSAIFDDRYFQASVRQLLWYYMGSYISN